MTAMSARSLVRARVPSVPSGGAVEVPSARRTLFRALAVVLALASLMPLLP